jgi:divalent metal cation (Fe/Co/Zn/Cd) transporter
MTPPRVAATERSDLVAAAIRWSVASLAWAVLAGGASVAAWIAAGSIALVGFGASSVLDGSASAVLIWRFRHEASGGDVERVERRAALAIGVVLCLLSAYLVTGAVHALATNGSPHGAAVGSILTAASVLVLPWLGRAKLLLAARLGSAGLRSDGVLSMAGAALAAAALVSLMLDAALAWWWADAVAALLIAALVAAEGTRAIRETRWEESI